MELLRPGVVERWNGALMRWGFVEQESLFVVSAVFERFVELQFDAVCFFLFSEQVKGSAEGAEWGGITPPNMPR